MRRSSSVLLAGLVAILAFAAVGTTTAEARTATGYRNGEKTELKIVECGGADVEVHTAKAFRLMAKAARKAGIELGIRSGYRSFKKQAALYKQYRKGNGNLAAPPGYSNHESGRALDLFVTDHRVYEWLASHASRYGFHRTVPGEAWHWEYIRGSEEITAREAKPARRAH